MNAARTFSSTAAFLSRAASYSVSSHTVHSVGERPQENRALSEERSSDALASLFCGAINDVLEGERRKFVPGSHIELVLELHPGEEQRGVSMLPAGRT